MESGGSPQATQTLTLTGRGYVSDPTWQKGEFVRVRYLRRDSQVACPVGARRNAQSAWYLARGSSKRDAAFLELRSYP